MFKHQMNNIENKKKAFETESLLNILSSFRNYNAATCLVNCDFKLPALLV